jgi:hypothetical protein
MVTDPHVDQLLQDYLHRSEKLRRSAWVFTAIPIMLFAVLSLLVASKAVRYAELSRNLNDLNRQIQEKTAELADLQRMNVIQQLAIKIVSQPYLGTRPKVVVYRLAVANQVKAALETLGYTVEERPQQANPLLANKPVDTLSYGCSLRNEEIRTVAVALTNAGIPIRRIVPAERNRDPDLIQLVSSNLSDDARTPFSLTAISNWNRPDKSCSQ